MGIDERERFQRRFNAERALHISQAINIRRLNLTHTCQMIYYSEERNIEDRESELLRTVRELELVYRDNREKLAEWMRAAVEKSLQCARKDITEQKDYWSAIYDVSFIEEVYLQGYLPKLSWFDESFRSNFFLARKIIEGVGGKIIVCRNEDNSEPNDDDYDSADWWKK